MKDRVWKASIASNVPSFCRHMEWMKEEDGDVYNWLASKPKVHWSRPHFGTSFMCDILLNNLCESLNETLVEARQKPILSMFEDIKVYLMRRMNVRRIYMTKWDRLLCPNIHKILEKNKVEAATCIPT